MSDPRSTAPPRRSVLHARHEARGAALTCFGGWEMPLRYGSELAEHRAVRQSAGLFDISHMAEFLVHGEHAPALLDHALTGWISTLPEGRARYSLVLADDGGIVDDVIVYRSGTHGFTVIANAGNRDAVATALAHAARTWSHAAGRVLIQDVSDDVALLALQGPRAPEILRDLPGLVAEGTPPVELGAYACAEARFSGERLLVARTGYTGEDGFELLVPNRRAAELWDGLLAAGAPLGLLPAGLAARDTLRLEAGMPLYGHELSREIRPAQAGLARAVATDKPDFVGKAGARPREGARVLVGLTAEGRRAGRAGYPVTDAEGTPVGEVTSGALSPTLGHPIAMAYLDPRHAEPGTPVAIDIRGSRVPATVTTLPFYRRKR